MNEDNEKSFEEDLSEYLQRGITQYLIGNPTASGEDVANYIESQIEEYTLYWMGQHTEQVLNDKFGIEIVDASGIDVSEIKKRANIGHAIAEGIALYIDVQGMNQAIEEYNNSLQTDDYGGQQVAVKKMTNYFLNVSEITVRHIPITGIFYEYIVDAIQSVFNAGYDHVSGHVVELEYTDAIYDYYTDNITLEDLLDRIEKIFPEEEAQERIRALLSIEQTICEENEKCIDQRKLAIEEFQKKDDICKWKKNGVRAANIENSIKALCGAVYKFLWTVFLCYEIFYRRFMTHTAFF